MRGQSKRYVNHKGEQYETHIEKQEKDESIGILELWRHATWSERALTLSGVFLALVCSLGVVCAVLIYGELTSLFVSRHTARAQDYTVILPLFGGGESLPIGNRTAHMEALIADSIAFGVASVAIMALQWSSAAVAVSLATAAARRTTARLKNQLLRTLLYQDMEFFDTHTENNFASVLTEDIEKLRVGVGSHIVMVSYLTGASAGGALLALWSGWELALVGIAFIPVAVVLTLLLGKRQSVAAEREAEANQLASKEAEQALRNIRTVRAYGGEDVEIDRYSRTVHRWYKCMLVRSVWGAMLSGGGWLCTYCMNAAVLGAGSALVVYRDDYQPGNMVTILFCTFMASQNIAMLPPHLEVISTARGAARNIYSILQRPVQRRNEGKRPKAFQGNIDFKDVYFNYPGRSDVKVLRGLNLTIKAGEYIALVGGSGCGKSTILQLLQGLYKPNSGTITIDGENINDLDLHHYRTNIGVVGQEPVLFTGTIRENIALGVGDVTDDVITDAARAAYAHQFITKLADGYNTLVTSSGGLSGGQRQRVCVARALVRRGGILLLDEPSAALDAASERAVTAATSGWGGTTVCVSHRLATIQNASRIIFIDQGVVAEEGTHTQLMEKKGHYWNLVQKDLTNKSVSSLGAVGEGEEGEGDDEGPDFIKEITPLVRTVSRQSSRASFTRDSIRRSTRFVGTHFAPAPLAAPEAELIEESDSSPPVKGSDWELLKLNAPEWPLLALGGVSSLLVGASMPVFALLFSNMYGMFELSDSEEILRQSRIYSGVFLAVAGVCGACVAGGGAALGAAGGRLAARARGRALRACLIQDQGFFDQPSNSVGALSERLATDCAAIQGATGIRLGTILQSGATLLIGVALSLPYSWLMTLISLCSLPFVIGAIYLEGVISRKSEDEIRKSSEEASKIATEALYNIRTVQSLGCEEPILCIYSGAVAMAAARSERAGRMRGVVYGACLAAPTMGYAASLTAGGVLVAGGALRYHHAILVSEALIYGAWMVAEALSFAPSVGAARRAGGRLLALLGATPGVTDLGGDEDSDWTSSGDVSFQKVSFSYPTRATSPVLREFSLSLPVGSTTAFVGPSGSGKTTLTHLLLRSYDPDSGQVTLDGRDIKTSLSLRTLRRQIGLVQQEPALFERTLRENIAYGDNSREVPFEEIVEAAKMANAHDFIMALPLGYDTVCTMDSLSGGQRQRVSVSRALIRRPRVLVLDEPTSALDAHSEQAVQSALEAASLGRTTLVIAHRLATVRRADLICVLDRGVIVEQGKHEELLRKRGAYYQLLKQQSPEE